MKHTFYIVLLTWIVSFGTFSCKKEQVAPSGFQNYGSTSRNYNDPRQPIYLTANNWKMDQQGIYAHTFQNILTANEVNKVRVYVLTDGREILINHFIDFSNGILWATLNTTDVKINFRCSGPLPFTFLNIKVAFE